MASVLIITTILNIVVSVVVSSEKQSSQFSPNKPLVQNDKKEVDRRTDTDSWGNQVKLDQLKSDKHENPSSLDRKKRQILFLVNRRPAPDALLRIPKSTQNPFIRETNVDEYDIGGPDDIEHIPQASDSGSHITSHQQVSEGQNIVTESLYQPADKKFELLEVYQSHIWQINPNVNVHDVIRDKRSPKMSKLYKKQKIKKKKMKKKKQKEPSPRQIKHYRRIRESREERRRILHKKLKEKRRLRHKKLGTGPYNKTIIDYYGVYFDSPSIQLNDSLYDSIYDSSALNTDEIYDERMKDYPQSELSSSSDYDIESYDKYGSRSSKGVNTTESKCQERKRHIKEIKQNESKN